MKKYKLIKEYPGSPFMPAIVEQTKITGPGRTVITKYFTKGSLFFDGYLIENSPKFWEEVIEKDYEILAFRCENHNKPYVKHSNGKFAFAHENGFSTVDDLLSGTTFNIIHSIKRLSDGEIFTVGDETNFGKINKFRIEDLKSLKDNFGVFFTNKEIGQLSIKFNRKEDGTNWNIQWLTNTKLVKKPLFTTEDGVEIFEGDSYRVINKNTFFTHPCTCDKYSSIEEKNFIKFSTKKAAEAYILMNKPCLSFNDISQFLNYRRFGVANLILAIIKTKL
jgi:hypothetical protein